jgi:aspartate/methionine/tyrosine aminotransferase
MKTPPVARRVAALRPTAMNAILAEARAVQQAGRSVVSLARGEPDLPTPPHIVEAAAAALRAGRTDYPHNQGEPELREAVAAKLRRQGLDYSPADEILITDGATLGICAALTAVLDAGDEILVPDPIYDAYQSPIALAGGVSVAVPAEIDDGRFALSADRLSRVCTPRTRAVLLNTPWNPTGTVLRRNELAGVAALAEERNLVIISDEIYESIIYDGRQHLSPVSLSPDARRRTILVNSFSKTYAMTGWRLGYCAGPAPLIAAMYLVLQQSSRGPATFVQDAGIAALNGPQECVAAMQAEYARRRNQVLAAFSDLSGVHVLAPEGGFFAMLDVRGLRAPSDEIRRRLLQDQGVVVVHGSAYGPAGEGTLRVSFASGGKNLADGLDRLRTGLLEFRR